VSIFYQFSIFYYLDNVIKCPLSFKQNVLANNITRYIEVPLQYIIGKKPIWWDYGKIPALANNITRYNEVPLQYIIAEKSIWWQNPRLGE